MTKKQQKKEIHLPMQETWVQSLGQEDPLEKQRKTHSNILAWEIPWTDGAWWAALHGGLKRVQLDLATKQWQQHGTSIFNSLRELCIVFRSGWTIYTPTSSAQGFTGSIFLSYIATYKWRKIWYGRTILTECCATYPYAT